MLHCGSTRTKFVTRGLLPVFAFTAGTALAVDPSPSLTDRASLGSFVDGFMEAQMEELKLPAAVVAIVKDDHVLYSKGYGYQDIEQRITVDPASSMFHIGSTGKLFTWTAVMQLVERGLLDLDTDVNEYLQTVRIPATFPQPVIVRHLLTHTAGFEEGFVGYLLSTDPSTIRPLDETLRRHMPARVRPPGQTLSYSNYGTALAGLIVQDVSGEPFVEYIERHIYEPLGIRYATFREPLPPELERHGVTGYKYVDGAYIAQPYEINGGFSPSGGTSMSALDMAKFMLAHLNGGRHGDARILEPETVALMHSPAFNDHPALPGMLYGFIEERINGHRVVSHGGDSLWFHSNMHLVPGQRLGIFVAYGLGSGGQAPRGTLTQALMDRYFPTDLPVAGVASDPGVPLHSYAGTYRMVRMNYTKFDKLFYLFVPAIEVAALPNGRLRVGPLGPESAVLQFEPAGEHVFRETGGHRLIAFHTDASGAVTRLSFSQTIGTERMPWYERPSLWYVVFGFAAVLLPGVLVDRFYRRREIRAMSMPERVVVRLAAWIGAWFVLMLIATTVVTAAYGISLLFAPIPFALYALLVMPLVFVLLTAGLVAASVAMWRRHAWTIGRRIYFTLVTLAALGVSSFCYQWNLLGWQFG